MCMCVCVCVCVALLLVKNFPLNMTLGVRVSRNSLWKDDIKYSLGYNSGMLQFFFFFKNLVNYNLITCLGNMYITYFLPLK